MKKIYPKYRIREGDTIESLTKFFGVKEKLWLKYHNKICPLEYTIKDELPEKINEIYLLPELIDKSNVICFKNIEIDTITPNHLSYKVLYKLINLKWHLLNRSYWVNTIIETKQKVIDIRYKIVIRYIKKATDNSALLLIHRISDVYVNNELPTKCMDELARHTGKAFYPLVFEANKKGELINIRNLNQIQTKWENEILPYIRLHYSGKIVDQYIEIMNDIISSNSKIENVFKNDLSIKMLLKSVYGCYNDDYLNESVIDFSIKDYKNETFRVFSVLNKDLDPKGYKEIKQEGFRLIKSPKNSAEVKIDQSGKYKSFVKLYNTTNQIRELWAQWDLPDEKFKLTFTLFPLREEYTDIVDINE